MKNYVYWITFIAINSGLLFGLNMAGISGAVDSIKDIFELSPNGLGLVVGILSGGCMIGALLAGKLADKYGRKKSLIATSIVFAISALGCALSQEIVSLTLFRLTSGIAVGLGSVLAPMYISEVSPAAKRGTLVSFNQFAVTTGILFAYLIDYALVNVPDGWRYMLGAPFIFSVIFLVLLLVSFPESPRWLLTKGKNSEALKVLNKINPVSAQKEYDSIKSSLSVVEEKSNVSFSDIFKGKLGVVVLIGTILAMFQQITGINAIINYAPVILSQTGIGEDASMLQSIFVGIINFLFTIIALWLIDTKGRKTLLLWGAAGMSLSLIYLSAAFAMGWMNIGVLIALLGYIASFAATFGAVVWVVTSEIYPNRIRSYATSFSTGICWGCSFLVVQFSPWILDTFGGSILFGLFGVLSLISFFFIQFFVPETKGKSLEQIEEELKLTTDNVKTDSIAEEA
ncbi:MAG: sugar porter family MFS transporter [Bacteroidales bacterium]|nr:sugar porter family MFS transporter [Bacteroidales bacterium]